MTADALATARVPAAAWPPEFTPRVRPMRAEELPWIIHSWSEGYKNSPQMRKKPWRDYRALDVPVLREALARRDTIVLVAEGNVDDWGVGWLAMARWPSVDVVHWCYTTLAYRRRGVMTALLTDLRPRVAYTHKGPIVRGEQRADLMINELLAKRGINPTYVPYKEWSR